MRKVTKVSMCVLLIISMTLQLMTPIFGATGDGADVPDLLITEICPDNTGDDNFEYFEVYNTTDADINLTEKNIGMLYIYSGTTAPVPLAYPENTVISAGKTVVFWLSYTSGNVDSFSKNEDDFKAFYKDLSVSQNIDYTIIRVTGQNGMANGGGRGIKLLQNDENMVWAIYPTRTSTVNRPAQFKLASNMTDGGMELLEDLAQPSPGDVDVETVLNIGTGDSDDTTAPTLSAISCNESATGTTIRFTSDEAGTYYYLVYAPAAAVPTSSAIKATGISGTAVADVNSISISGLESSTAYKAYVVVTDSADNTSEVAMIEFTTTDSGDYQTLPMLMVTELLPDSSNVGGADGYEFIEIYNNSNESIDFSDYKIDYLYPDTATDTIWPSIPENVVIEPGKTLVFWIINSANTAKTVSDFNTFFGTNLIEGRDIVKINSGGMANSGARGVSVVTNTKYPLSTACYNMNGVDDTTPDQGIQYIYNFNDTAQQTLYGLAPASPGSITQLQKPVNPVQVDSDATLPNIVLTTENPTISSDEDFEISAQITDNNQVKTVVLYLKSNLDEDYTAYNLTFSPDDTFKKTINGVDIIGKKYFEYYFKASDGTNITTSSVQTATVEGSISEPLRLSIENGDIFAGTVPVTVGGDLYPSQAKLYINDSDVTEESKSTLETNATFAFEVTGVDTFFQNGVVIGDEVVFMFDDGITSWETLSTPVDMDYFVPGENIIVSIYAGTKAKTGIDLNENNDDFNVRNLRLILPDGRTLKCAEYISPEESISMGDSAGKHDYINCTFTVPNDAYTALTYQWDTTAFDDGAAVVSAATDISNSVQRDVIIDNTPPVVSTNIEEKQYKGSFAINAEAPDALAGLKSLTLTLDGKKITLPYETSSVALNPGEHVLVITAQDNVGNTSVKTVTFSTPEENPNTPVLLSPEDSVSVSGSVTLRASVSDPTDDQLTVRFREGYRYKGGDSDIHAYSGTTHFSLSDDRGGELTALNEDELADIMTTDGISATQTSEDMLPYYLFDVDIPDEAGDSLIANVVWQGSANSSSKIIMYVMNYSINAWEEVVRYLTDNGETFTLSSDISSQNRVKDSKMTILIQHSEGYAATDLHEDEDASIVNQEDTPREDYDFTMVWESDTQYYNEQYYEHQLNIHNYIIENLNRMNIQYMFHTGDIVDDADQEYQWSNADPAYKMLDDIKFPYGVLAGNHDVSHKEEDYTEYYKYFGEDRYNQNPWYGGSYENNRGHYDLMSIDGIDFIMVYMGWGIGDKEISWLNQVLAEYPERKAILNFHEYILTTGGMGEVPQRIYDEVVSTNPNISMVFSGHYHDAYTRIDEFDDNGDGTNDRKVYSILFDYQGLSEGGLGYMRFMHFSLNDGKIIFRTYSPSLDDYDADDSTLELKNQEFEISFSDLGIVPTEKILSTDSIAVNLYTEKEISELDNVASQSEVSSVWQNVGVLPRGWYVEAFDSFGGISRSEVRYVSSTKEESNSGDGKGSAVVNVKPNITNNYGGSVTVSSDGKNVAIVPRDGYLVKDVIINGESVGNVMTYTFDKASSNNSIKVIFEKIEEQNPEGTDSKDIFSDVSVDSWYYESVHYVYENGLFSGISSTEFAPNMSMSRAMLVTVLHRMAGLPKESGSNFSDISRDEWYTDAVDWAVNNDIVNGIGNDLFAPNDNINREQLVTILFNYAKLAGMDTTVDDMTVNQFIDGRDVSQWASVAMEWAVNSGLIKGKNGNILDPKGNATRGEVSTLIVRLIDIMTK